MKRFKDFCTWIFVPILVVAASTAFADATFNLDSMLALIDQNHVTTLEEVLPLLPAELRSGFTLQYRGHGLQQASTQYPRAILFGNDAKFVVTFNGNESQGKYKSLEVIQFDERKSAFELYSLDFPIRRDTSGRAIRPQRNPAACTSCHGTSYVHPIWGRYNFWSGAFGSHDDKISDDESLYFQKFMADRNASPRYRVLLPRDGSVFSPYSSDIVETLSFRPNDILGSLFVRLNARSIAQRILLSQSGLKYFLLMSPLAFDCRDNLSGSEQGLLERRLRKVYLEAGYHHLPVPSARTFDTDNLVYLLGMSVGSFGLSSERDPLDPYFLDNFLLTTPNYVLGQIKSEFLKAYPSLSGSMVPLPFSIYLGNPRLVRTDLDRQIVQIVDSLGIGLKVINNPNCDPQLQLVRENFLN